MDQYVIDPKAGSPFPGLSFAGELDEVESQSLVVTMTEFWKGYLNLRLLAEFQRLFPGILAYLRFLPDPERGEVVMVPAQSEQEYGAVPVEMIPSLNGAQVNLRLAMKRMNIRKIKGRVYVFQVGTREAEDGQVYLTIAVRDAETRPAKSLKQAETATGAQTAAPAQATDHAQSPGAGTEAAAAKAAPEKDQI